jgi:hypothetical protein
MEEGMIVDVVHILPSPPGFEYSFFDVVASMYILFHILNLR